MHMTVFTVSSGKGPSVKTKDLRRKSDRLLELVSDVEVPRRVVFVESRKSKTKTWLPLRWLVPAATAAALVLALVIGGPIQFDRQESGMTIAFGALPEAEPLQAATQPVVVEPQPVDYEQIVARVTSEQQPWLESELESRIQRISAADGRKVQRLRAEMAYLSDLQPDLQRAALRDTLENASSIQLLAARTEVRE